MDFDKCKFCGIETDSLDKICSDCASNERGYIGSEPIYADDWGDTPMKEVKELGEKNGL